MGCRIFRADGDCSIVARQCLFFSVEKFKQVAARDVPLSEIGVDGERLFVTSQRFLRATQFFEGIALVVSASMRCGFKEIALL